ncbi:MAG: VacJ family lipoprotein [Pseudomonadota bacterium]
MMDRRRSRRGRATLCGLSAPAAHRSAIVAALAALLSAFLVLAPIAAPAQESPPATSGPAMDPDLLEQSIESAAPPETRTANDEDPWEGFNRSLFEVNTVLDNALMVPLARGYRAVTPKKGRRGIRRFLANLRAPGIFINDVLQGEFGRAGDTAARFFINTTIGAGGFADPAQQLGVQPHREDFGQTLAVWGVDAGPYLFLPLFGPTTARGALGSGVQVFLDPLFYIRTPPANAFRLTRVGVGGVAAREQFIEPLEDMRENSLDYYASYRSFYLQSRRREILNGVTDFDAFLEDDEFDDFDFDDFDEDDFDDAALTKPETSANDAPPSD